MNKLLALLSAILVFMTLFTGCTSQPGLTNVTPVQTQAPATISATPVSSPSSQSSFPTGITWRLFSYSNGTGGMTHVIGDQPITALFRTDGQLTGSSGCNQYTATYISGGSSIRITMGVSTLIGCSPQVMDQEMLYTSLLSDAATYSISGDTMLFYDSTGNPILAYKQPTSSTTVVPSSLAPVVGSWDLVTYNNGNNAMEDVPAGNSITAELTPTGQITGFSGCNQYSAKYSLNGQNIGISVVGSTKTTCDPDLMKLETQYLGLLTRANSYDTSGDQMTLYNALGDKILIYKKGTTVITSVPTTTPVSTPKTLIGSWELTSFTDGMGGTNAVLPTGPITARFIADGNLSGSAGCNQYVTSYSVSGASIVISPVTATGITCAPDVMAQQTAYLTLLQASKKYTLYGDSMSFSDSSGATLLTYKAAP